MSELLLLPEWVRRRGMNPLSGGGTRDLRPSLEKSQRWDLDEIFERDAVIEWGERFRICCRAERIEIRLRAEEGDNRVIEWDYMRLCVLLRDWLASASRRERHG